MKIKRTPNQNEKEEISMQTYLPQLRHMKYRCFTVCTTSTVAMRVCDLFNRLDIETSELGKPFTLVVSHKFSCFSFLVYSFSFSFSRCVIFSLFSLKSHSIQISFCFACGDKWSTGKIDLLRCAFVWLNRRNYDVDSTMANPKLLCDNDKFISNRV